MNLFKTRLVTKLYVHLGLATLLHVFICLEINKVFEPKDVAWNVTVLMDLSTGMNVNLVSLVGHNATLYAIMERKNSNL